MANYLKQKPGTIEDVIAKQQAQYQDPAYQKKFDEALKDTMGGIGSMTPKEKQNFYNNLDKKEGLETMVPNKKDDPKDLNRKKTMTGEKPTKVDMEPEVKMDTNKPYSSKSQK